jgi:hypothetical protein
LLSTSPVCDRDVTHPDMAHHKITDLYHVLPFPFPAGIRAHGRRVFEIDLDFF